MAKKEEEEVDSNLDLYERKNEQMDGSFSFLPAIRNIVALPASTSFYLMGSQCACESH